jgi:hypothetical protein
MTKSLPQMPPTHGQKSLLFGEIRRTVRPNLPAKRPRLRLLFSLVSAFLLSFASGATIEGGSSLLSGDDAQQLENWLGGGPITLTKIFTSVPGDSLTANDFHQVCDGLGATIVAIELPPQNGYARKIIGGYNPLPWESIEDYHYSNDDAERTAFLFNLTTGSLLTQKPNAMDGGGVGLYQTYNEFNTGPTFGAGFDLTVDFGLHAGYTYGWSYGPSGFGGSIAGGGQGNFGQTLNYGTIEVFAVNLAPAAPKASTVDADNVSGTSALLKATVSANLSATQVAFEYTTDPSFASGVITTQSQTMAGTVFGGVVSASVGALIPNSTYYFRVVATNALGTTHGAQLSFLASDASRGYRFAQVPIGNADAIGSATLGSSFTVNAACTLTHLGVYDHNQDGLVSDTPVGIWREDGTLLGSATVLSNDSLNGSCRYHLLATPVELETNVRYYVGAFYPAPETYGFGPVPFGTDSRVNFVAHAFRSGGFSIPDESQGSPGDGFIGYFGANFLLAPAAKNPIADAGPDQSVNSGDPVTLNGSASRDTNDPVRALAYAWTQISGPAVTLENGETTSPSFVSPAAPSGGLVLAFRLTVSNGSLTATDTVTVNVVATNHPPVANAGPLQTVAEGSVVVLDGSASSDEDGDPLTLQWLQISGPIVHLDDTGISNPSFTAPSVSAAEGTVELKFELVVNDGQAISGASTVIVRVKNVNDAPVAHAGANQSVNELETVTLDGTLSSDPDNDALSYSWSQILGEPAAVLMGGETANPSFKAPLLDLGGATGGATLTFQLTVSDGKLTSTSTVDVRVSNVNHPPMADAGKDQTVFPGALVMLEGSDSADTDGDALEYAWEQTGGPAVVLSSSSNRRPTFTAPSAAPGGTALKFKLTVSDGYGGTSTDETVVNVSYVNHPPVVSAGTPQKVNEGENVTLAGAASDPDGNPLVIVWSQVSGPTVTLSDVGTLTPSFTAPRVGRLEDSVTLRLTGDDNQGAVVSSEVTIRISNVNQPPSAQAPANLNVRAGERVTLTGQGTDPDEEERNQLTFSWKQVSGPGVKLTGTAGATVEFTAPPVTSTETLVFRLTVTDPNGAAATDDVDVVVGGRGNRSPIAIAGGSLIVSEGATVTLNGSASRDPEGGALTFSWVQTHGPRVQLMDSNTAYPYFTAPFVSFRGALLSFRLTVSDPAGARSSDMARMFVLNTNEPPNLCNVRPSVGVLWPPDHSLIKVSILGIIDRENNAKVQITAVMQDEPTAGLGDGDSPIDAIISEDGSSVLLRAERSGRGDGRVYRVYFTASDDEGSEKGSVEVYVPKNRKTERVYNSGTKYDSRK